MHTCHGGLSIIAHLKAGTENTVKGILMKHNEKDGKSSIFEKLDSTLLVSGVVIPAQVYYGKNLPATVMLITSFVGPAKNHLDELVNKASDVLCEIFQHCIKFPAEANQSSEKLKRFLSQHSRSGLFYSGIHHVTKKDIINEENLRVEIKTYFNNLKSRDGFRRLDRFGIRNKIQRYISSRGSAFEWAQEPYRKTLEDKWHLYRAFVVAGIVLVVILAGILYLVSVSSWFFTALNLIGVVLGIAFSLALIILLWSFVVDSIQDEVAQRAPDDIMRILDETQRRPVTNEISVVGVVKKGWLRRTLFKSILCVIAPFHALLDIPTIITARWISGDGGRRLIFLSNFSSKSESYVRDFVDSDSSTTGINLLFGHGRGYPKTFFLMWRGAFDDPEGFMNVFHNNHHPTQLWYWPFQSLSVDNIRNNRAIRNGLFGNISEDAIEKWLNRF